MDFLNPLGGTVAQARSGSGCVCVLLATMHIRLS